MLRRLTALCMVIAALSAVASAQAVRMSSQNHWVHQWAHTDGSIWSANRAAAHVFHVSRGTLDFLVNAEGGNVNPVTLGHSLCSATQPGWNTQGSYAFGPYQFMLNSKPACSGGWGTFAAYVHSAFTAAKRNGTPVPYRFKTPASNVGQAITAAYIVSIGQICIHWSASLRTC